MQLIIPRRVKVYILNGEEWIDNGTGYCTGEVDEKNDIPYFIVRNELDQSDVILKAYIEGTTQYQQQQETLIVWTDELGRDILLSFQEPNGCTSLCDFLIDVFQTYQPNISLVAVISTVGEGDIAELIVGPVEYPPLPTLKNLNVIVQCLNHGATSNYSKDLISTFILENEFIDKLIEIFKQCESGKKLKNLYYLCDIMKILILYSNTQIVEILLDDLNIMGVVGILEYDSEFPGYKSNHREYLSDESKFKEVVPIEDVKVKNKIKSTFRLQFLKDVVLAKLLDDATFNLIQTLIYFNQVDVIKFLQESNGYMEKLFDLYEMDNSDSLEELLEKKRDGVRMLHQFALIARTLQLHQRTDFFKSLISKGLFKMINFSLQDKSTNVRVLCTELIVSIIEHDVMLVNEAYINEEKDLMNSDMTLMTLLTRLFIDENDIGLKLQAFELIKVLLDPLNATNSQVQQQQQQQQQQQNHHQQQQLRDDDVDEDDEIDGKAFGANESEISSSMDISNYIQNFYSEVAPKLFEPLIKLSKLDKIDEELDTFSDIIDVTSVNDCIFFQHLCELVKFCAIKHEKTISRSFFLENNILIGLKNLIHRVFKIQLRLSAIRSIKWIISLDDEYYSRFIISNDILEYITQFDLTVNTLASSTVLSIIEIEDINKDTEERKSNYDLMMSYINDLIKFEEDDLIEEDKEDQVSNAVEKIEDVGEAVVDTVMVKSLDNEDTEDTVDNNIDMSTNKLKREVSLGSNTSISNESPIKSKRVKWVERLLNKKKI